MSITDFTDTYGNGYRVETSQCHEGVTYLTFLDNNPARWIPNEDAPAVALAVLLAAGHKGTADEDTDISHAVGYLRRHEAFRAERAEREALDDKVRAYLNRVLLNKVGDMYRITDHDRDEYARAAEFFQGEQ